MKKRVVILVLLSLLLPIFVSAQSGLISYWSFDDSGNPGDDDVGNNDGILMGDASWISNGYSGGAISFDGVGDFMIIDGTGTYDDYSISVWFKTPDAHTSDRLFSDAHNAGAGTFGRPDIHFVEGKVRVTGGYNGTAYPYITSGNSYDDNTWHHVVLVVRSGVNELTLYVDGNFVGSNINYAEPLNLNNGGDSDNRVEIGARSRKINYFNGTIDEVKIFSSALSAQEVSDLFNQGGTGGVSADLDGDGDVDIFDLIIVAKNFGTSNSVADTDSNGIVDIFDVVFVASRFGSVEPPPPPQCSGTCESNPCNTYDNCAPASGECTSGNCCSGACTTPGGGNVINAASLSRDDIQAAVNSASDGDIVQLPAGTNNNFVGQVYINNKEIWLRGAGKTQTILKRATPVTGQRESPLIYYQYGDSFSNNKYVRISDMSIRCTGDPADYHEQGVKIQNQDGISLVWNMDFRYCNYRALAFQRHETGVVWNCDFYDNDRAGFGYSVSIAGTHANDDNFDGRDGAYSWSYPLNFGDYNHVVYVEDCYFEQGRHYIASHGGARYTARFNTILANGVADPGGHVFDMHGTADTTRGTRQMELYNNTMTWVVGQPFSVSAAGDAIIYDNVLYNYPVGNRIYTQNKGCCKPWASSYPCSSLEGSVGNCYADMPTEVYVWGNTNNGVPQDIVGQDRYCVEYNPECFVEGTHYFLYPKPDYTPYTYPHPLRSS